MAALPVNSPRFRTAQFQTLFPFICLPSGWAGRSHSHPTVLVDAAPRQSPCSPRPSSRRRRVWPQYLSRSARKQEFQTRERESGINLSRLVVRSWRLVVVLSRPCSHPRSYSDPRSPPAAPCLGRPSSRRFWTATFRATRVFGLCLCLYSFGEVGRGTATAESFPRGEVRAGVR